MQMYSDPSHPSPIHETLCLVPLTYGGSVRNVEGGVVAGEGGVAGGGGDAGPGCAPSPGARYRRGGWLLLLIYNNKGLFTLRVRVSDVAN